MGRDAAAARLVERILTDDAFRARFREDPEGAARELGVAPSSEPALETLEIRESRSSLAGAMMAAAVEAVGVYDFVDQHFGNGGHGAAAHVASAQPIADLPPDHEGDDADDADDDDSEDSPDRADRGDV